MNPSKRAILAGASDVIEQIGMDEEQDLRDQPDSIEDAKASDNFRANVTDLKAVVRILQNVIGRE